MQIIPRDSKGQFEKGIHPLTEIEKGQKLALGYKWTSEQREKISLQRQGRIPWNKGKGTGIIPKTAFKKNNTPWNLNKKVPQLSGKNHWNWKGGIYYRSLDSWEVKLWRKEIFKRDNWTCILCGYRSKTSKDINADHIKPWILFPKLRFDLNNGRTLCIPCHKNTPTYGRRVFNYA